MAVWTTSLRAAGMTVIAGGLGASAAGFGSFAEAENIDSGRASAPAAMAATKAAEAARRVMRFMVRSAASGGPSGQAGTGGLTPPSCRSGFHSQNAGDEPPQQRLHPGER